MITAFDLIRWGSILVGICCGWSYGHEALGIPGAIVGAVLGFFVGRIAGQLPLWIALKPIGSKLKKMSEEELRSRVSDSECLIPNLVLLELNRRGLGIDNHLADVLDMLRSEDTARRGFGVAALTSAYPEYAKEIKSYNIDGSVQECIQNTLPLEKYAQRRESSDA